MIILPSKITEDSWFFKEERYREKVEPYLGRYYISYSSINSWNDLKFKYQFMREKLMGYPYQGNIYAEFGSWVGQSFEIGKVQPNEQSFLGGENIKKLDRVKGAEYERFVLIDFGQFIFIGFIDQYIEHDDGLVDVTDLKTGSKTKLKDYKKPSYIQVILYAHALEQEGKKINRTGVLFALREGSHKNLPLILSDYSEYIPLEYNKRRVNYALNKLQQSVFEISETYKTYLKYFG